MAISIDWAVAWLVAVSLTAACVTVWDKSCARRRAWRVSESTLWLVSALGGAPVMYVTMLLIRHKTLHRRFMIGLPLLFLAQAGAIFLLWQTNYLIFL